MPTYEYSCEFCGHQLEVFQSMNDDRLVTCPSCSKDGLKRLIGRGGGIIFKGSGFYETDYKNTSSGDSSAGNGEKPSSGDSAPAKPATASTPASSD